MNYTFPEKFLAAVPSIIRRDFLRKGVALFFALLVWLSISSKLGKVATIPKVNVNLLLPANLVRLDESRHQVSLRVSGSENRLGRAYPADFKINIKVDERNYVPGEPYLVNIDPDEIETPFGVKVLAVEPKVFFINLDQATSRTVEVRAKFAGAPPSGYIAGAVTIIPSKVTITGPDRLITNIDTMQTDVINLDKSTVESFDFVVPVQNNHKNISITPPQVLAQVEVRKEFLQRTFGNIPIRVIEAPGKVFTVSLLSTPHVEVEVDAPQKVMETLKPEQLIAFADLSLFNEPGVYEAELSCWTANQQATVKKITPAQVKVSIVKAKTEPNRGP